MAKIVLTLRDIILIMNIPEIVQKGTENLHINAAEVPVSDITSPEIKQVIANMKLALSGEPDGVAIAAPQIDISLRIFVVAGFVFGKGEADVAYINPIFVKKSKKTELMDEGCLSVRYMYGKVKRHTNVTIEAYNEEGEKIERGAGGLLAHIFQHETDHLNGILFVDKAESSEIMSEKEQEDLNNKRNDAKQKISN